MGVSDPGQDCSAMEINDGCRRPRQRSCLSIRADKQDSSTADRDRRDDWPRVVDGVNVAVGYNEIRRRLRSQQRWCERGHCEVG